MENDEVPCVRWQAFITANVSRPADVVTVPENLQLGDVTLVPSGLVRHEPNTWELTASDLVEIRVSSPVSVEGGPHASPYAPYAGPVALQQMWRACVLLTLETNVFWWPIRRPMVVEAWRNDPIGLPVERIEPTTASSLCAPPWYRSDPTMAPAAPQEVGVGGWLAQAWDRLDADPLLEEQCRTYLTIRRLTDEGHMFVEPVVALAVAIFDALGAGKHSITDAMTESFARHHCPDLRANAHEAAATLYAEMKPGRNKVAHDAGILHLIGHGSGPLGDRPGDLLDGTERLDMQFVAALVAQARLVLRGRLGAPSPEAGRCRHSTT
jgi:hypothetical protein